MTPQTKSSPLPESGYYDDPTAATTAGPGRGRTILSYVWALVPFLTAGSLTWAAFGYAAVRTRRWLLAVAAVAYLGAFIAFVAIASATEQPHGGGSSPWGALPFVIAWLGGTVHAFVIRRAVFIGPSSVAPASAPAAYPQAPEPVSAPVPEPEPSVRPSVQPWVAPVRRPYARRQRWKPWHVVVLTPILLLLGVVLYSLATDTNQPSGTISGQPLYQAPALERVTYELRGTAPGADITIDTGGGGTSQQSDVAIPLRHGRHLGLTFEMPPGSFAYISAQNTGEGGWITCYILVNGVVVQSSTSSGAYTIATCSTQV